MSMRQQVLTDKELQKALWQSDLSVVPMKQSNVCRGKGQGKMQLRATDTTAVHRDGSWLSTKVALLTQRARRNPKYKSMTLMHLFTEDYLMECFRELKKNKAPGVDGVSVEEYGNNLEGNIKELVSKMKVWGYKPQPVRRVYIPKSDGSKRGLGIPTVKDRVVQQALRIRLEPIFDTDFVESSYGFRKGKSAHQALGDVMFSIGEGKKWVVEVDIQGYFDTIDHEKLINLVAEKIADGRVLGLVRKMLKAGVMEEFGYRKVTTGTPQGGVISPLLANIFLDYYDQKMAQEGFRVIRYADDFVIVCEKKSQALVVMERTKKILEGELGLKLHPDKTRIVHATQGFEFLGYFIKQAYSLYAIPRIKAVKGFKEKVRSITRRCRPMRITEMVKELNRVIVGWDNYFRLGDVKKTVLETGLLDKAKD